MGMSAQLLASRDWKALVRSLAKQDGERFPAVWSSNTPFVSVLCAPPKVERAEDEALLYRLMDSILPYQFMDDFEEIKLDPRRVDEKGEHDFWQPITGLAVAYREGAERLARMPGLREGMLESWYTKLVRQPRKHFWSRRPPPLKVVDEQRWERDIASARDEMLELADVLDRLEAEGETLVMIVAG